MVEIVQYIFDMGHSSDRMAMLFNMLSLLCKTKQLKQNEMTNKPVELKV